jgi:hypothetical protein
VMRSTSRKVETKIRSLADEIAASFEDAAQPPAPGKFDRRAYQRDYMRKRRAAAKLAASKAT